MPTTRGEGHQRLCSTVRSHRTNQALPSRTAINQTQNRRYGEFCSHLPAIYRANTPQGLELPAYFIGALCAGGGTYGYIKTGSVPSVTAGVTVGALVRSSEPFKDIRPLTVPSTFWEATAFRIARHTESNFPS